MIEKNEMSRSRTINEQNEKAKHAHLYAMMGREVGG